MIKVVVVVGEATAEEVVVAGEEGGIVKWLRLRRYILQDAGLSFSCISTWPAFAPQLQVASHVNTLTCFVCREYFRQASALSR